MEEKDSKINLYASPVNAGFPSPATDYVEDKLDLNEHLVRHPAATFFVKASGDSMTGAGIFDGDIAIIKKQEWADNGDTAVAIIDDNEATLKKFYKEKGRIRLQPANPTFSPIFRKHVEIRGIAIKIIRDLARY